MTHADQLIYIPSIQTKAFCSQLQVNLSFPTSFFDQTQEHLRRYQSYQRVIIKSHYCDHRFDLWI